MALRHLALGDSYTIGEAVPAGARWPAQLAARLREQGLAMDEPRIVAATGWTTDELAAAMERETFAPPYDLVSLLIGVNDQYRGRGADEYRGQFAALHARAVALAGDRPQRVLVVSIPDWGVTRFAREGGRDAARIAAELDTFNALARGQAAHAGSRYVDVTGISRRHPELVADDGLHPDAAQYALWTAAILPAALEALHS